MKRWDRKYRMVLLAFALVVVAFGMLWVDMMNWNHSAIAHECGIVAFYVIMTLMIDYRKAVGLTLCLIEMVVFVIRNQIGGRGPLWLIPSGLLVLYFVWCIIEISLKRRVSGLQPDIPGESPMKLDAKSNG